MLSRSLRELQGFNNNIWENVMSDKLNPASITTWHDDDASFPGDPPPVDHCFDEDGGASPDFDGEKCQNETNTGQGAGKSASSDWRFPDFVPEPRALVRWLKKLRKRQGYDKLDLARRLCCDVRAISAIEKGYDRELTVGDISEYVDGLGMSCVLQIIDDDLTGELELQRTLIEAERWLMRLYRLFEKTGDKQAMREVERFVCQTLTTPIIDSMIFGDRLGECDTAVIRVVLSPSI